MNDTLSWLACVPIRVVGAKSLKVIKREEMLWPNSEIALLWGKRCRCKNDQVQQFGQLSDFFVH